MKQHQSPRRRRWRRIGWIALAVPPLLVALWLLDHLRPRHAYFEERRGSIVAAEVVEDATGANDFVSRVVHLRSTTGLRVNFRVLRPVAAEARIPAVVVLAGHRTGSKAVELVGDPGAVAVIALDYPYHGAEKLHGFWTVAKSLPAIQRTLLDTPPAVSLVLDWLLRQPWVDPGRVELLGASLGTPFAAVAGARDTRFRRVWLIHGGARNREWLGGALRHDISNDTLRGMAASLLHLLAHGASFDTEY
ncbi:MAG: alpha/beta hydrolase family protein [Opitutaceae bacterium]